MQGKKGLCPGKASRGVATGGTVGWEDPIELDEMREIVARDAKTMLPAMRRLVDYTHHRTLQRLTLDAVARSTVIDPDAIDPDATEELPLAEVTHTAPGARRSVDPAAPDAIDA